MKIDLLLLAAGKSKRFGGIKQLAAYQGQPMICYCLSVYQQGGNWLGGIAKGTVVLGANANKIVNVLPKGIDTYFAPSWENGLGHSLAESVAMLSIDTTHVLIGLADQVRITSESINEMLACSKLHPQKIIAAAYSGRVGAPAIFPQEYFSELRQLQGDKGAKDILQDNANKVVEVLMPEAAIDIDTQADFFTLTH